MGADQGISPAVPSLLAKLRRETAPLHERVERLVSLDSAALRREDYRRYLRQMLGFLAPLEPQLAAVPGLSQRLPDLARRQKLALLCQDLRALGEEDPLAAPRCESLPRVEALPEALGCLYVLEGSTLGGLYLHRLLKGRLPEVMEQASAFLRCYGAETRVMWRRFGEALQGVSEVDEGRVIAAANETFLALERWLSEERG